MLDRSSIHASAAVTALLLTVGVAQAFDDAKYPDLKGRWERAVKERRASIPPSRAPSKIHR